MVARNVVKHVVAFPGKKSICFDPVLQGACKRGDLQPTSTRQAQQGDTTHKQAQELTQHGGQAGGLVEAHDRPAVPDEVEAAHVQVDLAGGVLLGLQVHDVQHVLCNVHGKGEGAQCEDV